MASKKKAARKGEVPGRKAPRALTRQKKKRLRLKIGGYYKNRLRELIGPMGKNHFDHPYAETHPLKVANDPRTYALNGCYYDRKNKSPNDLVREVKRPGKG